MECTSDKNDSESATCFVVEMGSLLPDERVVMLDSGRRSCEMKVCL